MLCVEQTGSELRHVRTSIIAAHQKNMKNITDYYLHKNREITAVKELTLRNSIR